MSTHTPLAVPQTPAVPPLMARLVRECAAEWVDETTVAAWSAKGGDRVLLLAGDPVQFPEGMDVAAVLPELMRRFPGQFSVAVVPRQHEEAVAKRYGSQRWPTLIFLREGAYVTALAGMQDWDVYVEAVATALNMPSSRAPTVGIPVVTENTSASTCH